jgi:hypothetical protein
MIYDYRHLKIIWITRHKSFAEIMSRELLLSLLRGDTYSMSEEFIVYKLQFRLKLPNEENHTDPKVNTPST